jgi:hypothetical protein
MSGSTVEAPSITTHTHSAGAILRFILIALTAFLTVVNAHDHWEVIAR